MAAVGVEAGHAAEGAVADAAVRLRRARSLTGRFTRHPASTRLVVPAVSYWDVMWRCLMAALGLTTLMFSATAAARSPSTRSAAVYLFCSVVGMTISVQMLFVLARLLLVDCR